MSQEPEQQARERIDKQLRQAGWAVQDKNQINFNVFAGVAVREFGTDVGPADYVLFIDRQPVGVIEAKREEHGEHLTQVEEQSGEYATAKLRWIKGGVPLPYVYESTGVVTRFRDQRDPKPRSREVFSFHRPESFNELLEQPDTLRVRLTRIPLLKTNGLRDCQTRAIVKLEDSFAHNRPRALIQMATGAGKTYTAITFIYRLLKHAGAKRVLFLVDTRNLGEQAEQEFMAYLPNDDNRKFTELYNVQRLQSGFIADSSQVCISTIQRLYSILKGEPLDQSAEQDNPAEHRLRQDPLPVVYNARIPIEHFDFIVIDECHRSIYNVWQQVLDYFDAFLIGLTATPDKRTFGFFHENVVSEYAHEDAVADGVNVGHDVYRIDTKVTREGALIAKQQVEQRDRLTRRRRWQQMDEDLTYNAKQLDKDVVNPSQIRRIVRTFRDQWSGIFPGREELPKTLVFAKTDSHADDIIKCVREEFDEGNDFCKKITYQTKEDPKSVLAGFRNDYNPRIAVTVDMIATGTDVKPLECLLFMRDVKSRNYFDQMKGRGTRTLDHDGLRKVTPSATGAKTHFVLVDAVGVTESLKTETRPLERKPGISLKDLLYSVMLGGRDPDTLSSLANRLARLNKGLTPEEQDRIADKAGKPLATINRELLHGIDPDRIAAKARELHKIPEGQEPDIEQQQRAADELAQAATQVFTGEVNELIESIRRSRAQTLDHVNLDELEFSGWSGEAKENARKLSQELAEYLQEHKDEITALSIFYDQPYRRRDITYQMISELLQRLHEDRPHLAPLRVWQAYAQLDDVLSKDSRTPRNELTALVSLIRRACGIDATIAPFDDTVRRNFKRWIFNRQSGNAPKFSPEQVQWLNMIRDHIANSFHLERDDLELAPFDGQGGLGRMWDLFGEEMDGLIDEMNEALAA